MGRIKTAVANLFWGVMGNALYSALAGGAVLTLLGAIVSRLVHLPTVWTDRAVGALGGCVLVALFTALISTARLLSRRGQNQQKTDSVSRGPVELALGRMLPNVVIQQANVVNIFQRDAGEYEATVRIHTVTLHATVKSSSSLTAQMTIAKSYEEIVNQTFRNQEVPLDGYRYVACTFENVTFVYNNGTSGRIDPSCRWIGSPGFKSRDERIQQLLLLLQSLKIIPSQTTRGLYTQVLADLPNPASDAVIIKSPNELASYWSRLISARGTSNERFADMENTYDYVLNFWHELENNKDTDGQKLFERNFPGQSLTPEQIDEFRDKFLAGATALRASLLTLLNLLAFQFPKLGV